MLSSSAIFDLLENIPQGYLSPDNELFTTSNTNLLKSYKKLGAINNCEFEDINNESAKCALGGKSKEIFCNVLGCDMIFDNVCLYQSHYNTMHRNICSECRKSMPTEHLLDLHISEQHDSYFRARAERGERLHKCYLEECPVLFLNSHERKEHCIKEHRFPSNFRFDKMVHRNLKNKELSDKRHLQIDLKEMLEDKKPVCNRNKEYKFISFGHQKEKTFHIRGGSKHKLEDHKTLENMNTLKEAIDSI